MNLKIFKKDEKIFDEGSTSDDMYLILSGKVSVFKTIDGEKVQLAFLEEGDFIGEMSLFLNEVRTASIEAMEETRAQLISKEAILDEIQVNPKFAHMMITMLVTRIKNLHQIIIDLQGVKKSYEIMYRKD
jgi:CRP-like cAMP-binding protein